MTVTATTLEASADLAPLREQWDALAVAAGRPYAAPAWMLAWWEHCRPAGAELRVVVVREGDRLAGIAPFYAQGSTYRLLGDELAAFVEPLAAAGAERTVAEAVVAELAHGDPPARTVRLLLQGATPSWPELLGAAWPGGRRPWHSADPSVTAPFVALSESGDFGTWLAARSSKLRYAIRSGRRKLEAAGGAFRLTTRETLERDVDVLLRLHRARHEGASVLACDGDGMRRMLTAAGGELLPSGRFRLVCLDIGDRIASAQLMVMAGSEAAGWNGGFDQAFAKLSPALHTVIRSLEYAIEDGCERLDLGPGDHPYKQRLADGERQLVSSVLVPRGSGYALTRLGLATRAVPRALRRQLPANVRTGLRRGVRRGAPVS